jgi:hypothetical protein
MTSRRRKRRSLRHQDPADSCSSGKSSRVRSRTVRRDHRDRTRLYVTAFAARCCAGTRCALPGSSKLLGYQTKGLTSGTSWHAAGIVGPLRATLNLTKLAQYGTELFPCLEERTGQPSDYALNKDGSVTLADGTRIPPWQVLKGPNPTGHAVWWRDERFVTYCFAPGSLF